MSYFILDIRNKYVKSINSSALSNQASSCLTNVPTPHAVEIMLNGTHPGYSWTADDQCQAKHGNQSSFCHVNFLKLI